MPTSPISPLLIDGAVHVWSGDAAAFPWRPLDGVPVPDAPATVETLLATLRPAGFAGAVCVQPRAYGYDHGYLAAAVAHGGGRLAGVGLVEPAGSAGPARLRELVGRHGFAGARVVALGDEPAPWLDGPAGDPLWDAAAELGVPISLLAGPERLEAALARARRSPAATLVLDHLGLVGAHADPDRRAALLRCAQAPNVVVKVSALPELSRTRWPYADLRELVHAVLAAFGPERVVFGTDWPHALDHGPWDGARRALIDGWGLAADEQRGLLGANAARLWKLADERRAA